MFSTRAFGSVFYVLSNQHFIIYDEKIAVFGNNNFLPTLSSILLRNKKPFLEKSPEQKKQTCKNYQRELDSL